MGMSSWCAVPCRAFHRARCSGQRPLRVHMEMCPRTQGRHKKERTQTSTQVGDCLGKR